MIYIYLTIAICTFIGTTTASTCDSEHPQQKYCRADFVVKANIHRATDVEMTNLGYHKLNVSLRTQIKVNRQFMDLTDAQLSRVLLADDVAHKLMPGLDKYILSGSITTYAGEPTLTINACDWVQQWSTLGQRHKAALRKGKFDMGCQCKHHLQQTFLPPKNRKRSCVLPAALIHSTKNSTAITECYIEHSHCVLRKDTALNADDPTRRKPTKSCHWANNNELKDCLTRL